MQKFYGLNYRDLEYITNSIDVSKKQLAIDFGLTYNQVTYIRNFFRSKKLWRKYTEEEKNIIKKMYFEGCSVKKIAFKVKRTEYAVRSFLSNNNIKKRISFTEKENEYLIKNYSNKSTYVLAEKLNRSIYSIYAQAARLHQKKDYTLTKFDKNPNFTL